MPDGPFYYTSKLLLRKRNKKEEILLLRAPTTLGEVVTATRRFLKASFERVSCGLRPYSMRFLFIFFFSPLVHAALKVAYK